MSFAPSLSLPFLQTEHRTMFANSIRTKRSIASSKSIAEKLSIKAGQQLYVANAPRKYRQILGELPDNLTIQTATELPVDVVLLFINQESELIELLPIVTPLVKSKGKLWIVLHKDILDQAMKRLRELAKNGEDIKYLSQSAVTLITDDLAAINIS